MDRSRPKNRTTPQHLLFISLTLPLLLATIANGENNNNADRQQQHNPDATERAIGITTPTDHWGKIQAWIKMGLLNLLYGPPDLQKAQKPPPNTGDLMKDAIANSYETSKSTAEGYAKMAGKTAKITAEAAKRTLYKSEGDQDDL